jgi:hypothetical protein
MVKSKAKDEGVAVIEPANMVVVTVRIRGTAPYVQCAFPKKQREIMEANMSKTSAERKSKTARPPRDFASDFVQAQHLSVAGWNGIPCGAFRTAMVDACRTVNLQMTRAKMSIFVQADGFDAQDGTPLIRLVGQPPERTDMLVRNDNGSADIRVRPMWREWTADIRIEFDADMITAQSVVNLLDRAGRQVGVGEGRPFSKNSVGMGWGTFTVIEQSAEGAAA